ncbi:MAG: SDR family oxidoreductase [Planctomycetota bacterium]
MSDETQKSAANFVVLGAAGGIGSATARQLVSGGARVLLAGRPSDRLTSLAEELDAPKVELDALNADDVESAFTTAATEFGEVNGVANCVGSLLLKPVHLTTDDEWDSTIATNLRSAFATVKGAAKTMRKGGGSVVLVSSAAARLGFANHEAIAAAKAGVIGLTLSAATTYAPRGIRVNAVAPGLVKTELTESIWSKEASAKTSEDMHAIGRLGEPEDIASAICWLLDPANSWITGEVISVDGGLSHLHPTVRRKPS